MASPVVQVQAVLEGGRHARELVATAHDVEVGVAVAVRVEEHGAQVLRHAILLEDAAVAAHEAAVGLLDRSEEHTSELQSQSNLVCRLLLEKKKKKEQLNLKSAKYVNIQKSTRQSVNELARMCYVNIQATIQDDDR